MKNLTRLFIIVLIGLLSVQANAQTFGLKAGLNLANFLDKDDDETYSKDYTMNPGFHLGLTIESPLTNTLSFESGLLLSTKGMKYEDSYSGATATAKVILYYLDVPLTLKATHDLGGGIKMFGTFGPYVGLGLSGKIKSVVEYQGDKETDEQDINWGSDEDNDDLKRLDAGLTFGGGIEVNAVSFGIAYDLGLANISSYQDYGSTTKNRVLRFSVGFKF